MLNHPPSGTTDLVAGTVSVHCVGLRRRTPPKREPEDMPPKGVTRKGEPGQGMAAPSRATQRGAPE